MDITYLVLAVLLTAIFYRVLNEFSIYFLKKRIRPEKAGFEGLMRRTAAGVLKKGWTETLKEMLERAGNPVGLNPERYIALKAGLLLFSTAYVLAVDTSILQGAGFAVLAFFGPDIYLYSVRKEREKAFRREMPLIADIFELGAAADVPFRETCIIAAEAAGSKAVKNEMMKLATEYIITGDKEVSLKRYCRAAGIPEAEVLAMALLQGERTGRTLEILASFSASLYTASAAAVTRQEKLTDYKVLAAIFTLMASAAMLYIYPYFTNLERGLRGIF